MAKKKEVVKLPKKEYILIEDFVTHDKKYKKGSKILLTEEGRAYLKSINKI